MKITWTKDFKDSMYSSHTGVDEQGNIYHESANMEIVSVETLDGKHGIGWTAEESLENANRE
jgi:hypothetical protein